MQTLRPITLSALAAAALAMSLQLVRPILGVTGVRWTTRPAAASGVGLAAVLLTEPLGHEIPSAFGPDLPWGRWPGIDFRQPAVAPDVDRRIVWLFNVPSLWVWSFGAGFTGLGLVWFPSCKMQLASPVTVSVAACAPTRHITKDRSDQEQERLRQGGIAVSIIAARIIFVTFTFGR